MNYIEMASPSGKTGKVPLYKIDTALKRGYVPQTEDGLISLDSPSGRTGNVKVENLSKALDRGYKITESTASDIPKEFATGVASGTGNLIDNIGSISNATVGNVGNLAHEYIGAPIDRARSSIVEGTAKGLDYVNEKAEQLTGSKSETLSGLSESTHKRAEELTAQADEEEPYSYKQNLKKDLPEAIGLEPNHKARNKTVDAVRTAGEFVPDVVDAVLISKGAGQLAKGVGSIKAIATNGKVVNSPWLDKLNKFLEVGTDAKSLAKLGVGFAGAGAGYSLAKKGFRPESEKAITTTGKIAQSSLDLAREVVGMTLGSMTTTGVCTSALRNISRVATDPKEILSFIPFTRKSTERKFVDTYGGEINEKIVKIARDNRLPPRLDMLTDNPKTSRLIQNTLRSGFVDHKVYKPFTQVGEKIKNKIDTDILYDVSPYQMSKEEVGDVVTQAIKAKQDAWKVESSRLYDEAEKLAVNSPVDVTPLKELLEQRLSKLEYGAPEDFNTVKNNLVSKLNVIESGKTGLEDLFAFKKALNKHGQDDKTNAGLYGEVADTINDMLHKHATSGEAGSEFTKAWSTAVQYNKNNVQAVKQMDVVRSLLKQNTPRETLDYMSSGRRIKEVVDILGKENSKIVGIVKRSKIEDIFAKSAAFSKDDVNPEALVKLLKTKEDLLKELMGKSNYKKFTEEFLVYAKEYDNAKGIVWSARDMQLIENQERLLGKSTIGAVTGGGLGFIGGEIAHHESRTLTSGIGAVIGAVVPFANAAYSKYQIRNIKMLSQIAADPKILNRIIKNSRAGKYGKIPKIDKYLPKTVRTELSKKTLNQAGDIGNEFLENRKKYQEENKGKLGIEEISKNKTFRKGGEILRKMGF